MSKTEKRQSLCVDALGGPATYFCITLAGWICALPGTWMACHFSDTMMGALSHGIFTFIVLAAVPTIISRQHPYLVTAILRSLWFAEYYDAD